MKDIREQRPASTRWRKCAMPAVALEAVRDNGNVLAVSFWSHPSGVRVISTLERAEYPDGSGEVGPQWHISIARPNQRPHADDVELGLRAFDMVGAEEDNHHPGVARHFWKPVDPARRTDCECKVTEAVIVDPDGYTWTNPKPETGEACCDCEMATWPGFENKPCPIHGAARAGAAP